MAYLTFVFAPICSHLGITPQEVTFAGMPKNCPDSGHFLWFSTTLTGVLIAFIS
jgi:hypothetical protein